MISLKKRLSMASAVPPIVFALLLLTTAMATAAPPLTGAIFTTDSTCTGVNVNIYSDKGAVYLDGGPTRIGAAGLPDGSYYVQVTEPDGSVLGKTTTASVSVNGGEFEDCYQLSEILFTATSVFTDKGYDTTSNPGGVYKVWVSTDSNFSPSSSKTDNFKVIPGDVPPPSGRIQVVKFYDANANGINDGELSILDWKVQIKNGIEYIRYTPVDITVAPGPYTVTEFEPIQTNWQQTTPNPVSVVLANGGHETVTFGNLCLGAGGGKTLGYWSNKNGQSDFTAITTPSALMSLQALNLRNASGADFNPTTYAAYRTWVLGATATNMSYMLSAQLSAMHLNVRSGKVAGTALIYAPGTMSANLGFASVSAVMAEANTALGANGSVLAGSPDRSYQEALKNALDNANNNLNFVQATPCPFDFAD